MSSLFEQVLKHINAALILVLINKKRPGYIAFPVAINDIYVGNKLHLQDDGHTEDLVILLIM